MALVDPDGSLTLVDGTKINTADGSVIKQQDDVPEGYEVVPSGQEAIRELTAVRRNIEDLPAPTESMNPISAVLSYHLFGLRDIDIAHVSGLTLSQVEAIRESDAFKGMLEKVVEAIYAHDQDDIRGMFKQNARIAASKLSELMNSESESIKLNAANAVLDRSGNTVKQIIEHQHQLDGTLVIEYRKRSEEGEAALLDLDAKDVTNGSD